MGMFRTQYDISSLPVATNNSTWCHAMYWHSHNINDINSALVDNSMNVSAPVALAPSAPSPELRPSKKSPRAHGMMVSDAEVNIISSEIDCDPTSANEPAATSPPLCILGIRFSRIHEVISMLGGRGHLEGLTTRDVQLLLKPITASSGLSLCAQLETLYPGLVAKSNWFISHAWDYSFLDVIEAVDVFMTQEYSGEKADEPVIWFDLLSVSQHSSGSQPFEWYSTIFMEAVRNIGNVLMIMEPWENPKTLTRAWCVFEIFACMSTTSRFEVSMSNAETERFSKTVDEHFVAEKFHGMLSKVNTAKSTAYHEEDIRRIHGVVRQLIPNGFTGLDSMLLRSLETWMASRLLTLIDASSSKERGIDLRVQLSMLLRLQGKLEDAHKYAVDSFQFLGAGEHESTQRNRVLMNLGAVYEKQGKYDAAEPLYRQCHEAYGRVLGSEHPDSLASMNNLANLYQKQGKYRMAEPLYRQCQEIRSRVLGLEHADTLSSMNNMAVLYEAQGKYDMAEPLYRRCHDVRCKVLGLEHPDTLSSMNSLAGLYHAQGKYDSAEPLYRQCYEISGRVFGLEHPDTLASINDMAVVSQAQGQYDVAEHLYQRCHEARCRVLGPEHPDTLMAMNNWASLHKARGKYDMAEPLYRRCLEISSRVLGMEHPTTIGSMNNLAGLYQALRKYELAEPLYQRCYEIYCRVVGREHRDALGTQNNLANLYQAQGKYDMAESLYQRCYEIRSRVLGLEHPDTLTTINSLSCLYQMQGKYDKAEPFSQRCFEIRSRVLGSEHPATLASMNNLAGLYHAQEKYDMATPLYERCLEVSGRVLGLQHPNTLGCKSNLAILYQARGQLLDEKVASAVS
jgi:tetratricopeptide (TPR) repeat protein